MSDVPAQILSGQECVREAGLCGELIDGASQMCIREAGHEPPHGDAEKFWRVPGVYIERLPTTDGLRIWVHGRRAFLTADSAESLLQWLDRSRGL